MPLVIPSFWIAPSIEGGVEALQVDPEFRQQPSGHRAVLSRTLDGLGSAVGDEKPLADGELVTLRVAAQVIVVVEHQDPGIGPGLAIEVCRGESADSGADNDQVVSLAGVRGSGR